MKILKYDYVVIGSGVAGLSAALKLSDSATVCVITKGELQEGSTEHAQGGIAVAMNEGDNPELHLKDTLIAGAGLCDTEAVSVLVNEGPLRVKELIAIGTKFDQKNGKYDFTREGAHGRRRILHVRDETGKQIEKSLATEVSGKSRVDFFTNSWLLKILVTNGRCIGCLIKEDKEVTQILARGVIIASGGCGQLYLRNSNPDVITGDGIAQAYNAGALVQDMEFMQFHPTTLYAGDDKAISIFLISEAVRGEGAILRNIKGDRFMQNYHELAELAPRDIVSRSIFNEMKKTAAPHVYLDLSKLEVAVKERFPNIYQRCLEAKIDIEHDFIPVGPAAHYFMGGIKIDLNGRTNISGLYACGEASSVGIHGANRLASNSLLEGLVFGARAAESALVDYFSILDEFKININFRDVTKKEYSEILAAKQTLRNIMWTYVGIERHEAGLLKAESEIKQLNWVSQVESDNRDLIEIQNMLIISKLIINFALKRTESRGAHYRSDYSLPDDKWLYHLSESIPIPK